MAMSEDALRASIKEKKAELAALEQLRDQSSALVAHLEAMKGKFGEIKEGTVVAADVLARWSELFALVAARDSHRLVLVPQPKPEVAAEAP